MPHTIAAIILALGLTPALSMAAQMEATILELDRGKGRVWIMTPEGRRNFKVGNAVVGLEHVMQGARVLIVYSESKGTLNVTEIIAK